MNPDTLRFEPLQQVDSKMTVNGNKPVPLLLRPNGEPVPAHWTVFTVGEHVVIKEHTFKVAYIGETVILFEPVGPVLVGQGSK